MAVDKAKLKMGGMIFGFIVVLVLLVFAALFISGMAEGTFTIFGFDRPSQFYSSLNLNQDVKPIIGTGQHTPDSVVVSWTPRSDLSSGVIDPTTHEPLDTTSDMGYIVTPYVNGSAGSQPINYKVVPGIMTSNYNMSATDLSNITGLSDFSKVNTIAFTVKTYVKASIIGNASSMSGTSNPSLGENVQHFMNFNKPSTKEKITHLKLHNNMHVRGPDSLKNLNSSSKVPHHGPKVGVLDSNTVADDSYFQSPF